MAFFSWLEEDAALELDERERPALLRPLLLELLLPVLLDLELTGGVLP